MLNCLSFATVALCLAAPAKPLTPAQVPPAPVPPAPAPVSDSQDPLTIYKADGTIVVITAYTIVPSGGVYYENRPPMPPTPPLPPTPVPLSPLAIQVRDAANDVSGDPNRAVNAAQIAELYRQTAALAGTKILDQDTLRQTISVGTDKILNGSTAWGDVRTIVSEQWLQLESSATTQLSDYVKILIQVADGLDASSVNAKRDKTFSRRMSIWAQQILEGRR